MAVLWIFKFCLELWLYIGNWFFDFLRAMVVDPKNHHENCPRSVPVFDNCPTLVFSNSSFSPFLFIFVFPLFLCGVFLSSLSFELLSYQHHRFSCYCWVWWQKLIILINVWPIIGDFMLDSQYCTYCYWRFMKNVYNLCSHANLSLTLYCVLVLCFL